MEAPTIPLVTAYKMSQSKKMGLPEFGVMVLYFSGFLVDKKVL